VSLDGWRWDYLQRLKAPHLKTLAARGVLSQGLIPSFPSKTYPNHFTIVTGLYPEHHGIVANNMSDATISSDPFSMTASVANDPRWWGGEPIWATAVSQGLRASSMFWPGSDVAIGGVRPTDWLPYDQNKSNGDRVTQALAWLARPEPERPSFVTMYFSDVDTAGHIHGPGARETLAAAEGLDSHIGHLVAGLERLGLLPQTTLIVVSDHGMSLQAPDRKVFIDDYIDLKFVDVIDWSPVLQLRPKATATVDEVYRALRGKHPSLAVYRREDVPRELHYSSHPRIAPVVAIASEGWQITTRQRFNDQPGRRAGGDHGYDPRVMQMHGLFVAAGPTLRQGLVVPRFENVHIYELMCRVLGLRPAKNDGDPAVTAGWMRSSAAQTFALRSRQSVRQSIPGS
jgi:predicted AlkP superfamily pyrophosphatase or phosphodiesterase